MCHAMHGTGHTGEFWQNMLHWSGEWQTTPIFLPPPHALSPSYLLPCTSCFGSSNFFSSISCWTKNSPHLPSLFFFVPLSKRRIKLWLMTVVMRWLEKLLCFIGILKYCSMVWDPFVSTTAIYLCFMAFDFCAFNSTFCFAPFTLFSCQVWSGFTDLLYLTSFPLWAQNPILEKPASSS